MEGFLDQLAKRFTMAKSTSTTLILVLLIICTFPIWIGIAGGVFGLAAGVFGAVVGIIAALFGTLGGILGAIFGAIAKVFSSIFGTIFHWGDWHPHIHLSNPLTIAAIILVIVLIAKSRKQSVK